MGRFSRHHRGPHKRFKGPKPVRPNHPHFRNFRREAERDHQQQQQRHQFQQPPRPKWENSAPPQAPSQADVPVAIARGPGHSRIMGRIEYEIRTLLRVVDAPPDQTLLYLACAREMYSDIENTKPNTVEAALDSTVARWLARNFEADIVKRIRSRVTDIYNSLKAQRFNQPPAVTPAAAAAATPAPVPAAAAAPAAPVQETPEPEQPVQD